MIAHHNLTYTDPAGRIEQLDLYVPTGTAPAGGWPAILALPGGGWRWVRRSDLGNSVSEFAKFGYVVAVADYAYASSNSATHVYPKNIDDVRNAVRWLKTTAASKYGVDPGRIAAWGESAGGNLASLLGTNPNGSLPGDSAPPSSVSASVRAVVDFYGPTDLAQLYQENPRVRPYLQTFLGGSPTQQPARYAAASPLQHVSAAAPPFLIFHGTADKSVPVDQSEELATNLAHAGVPTTAEIAQGLPHGFRLQPGNGVDYTSLVLEFLNGALKVSTPKASPLTRPS